MSGKRRRHPLLGSNYAKIRGMIDQDYTDKLSKEEKEFLYKFNQTYYLDNIHKEMLTNPDSQEALSDIGPDATEKEYRKYLGRRNNARNRDIYCRMVRIGTPVEWLTTGLTEPLFNVECIDLLLDYDVDEDD